MTGAGSIAVAFRATLGRFQLDAAFRVPAQGVTALFGPSGCGKTTVLRCIAGLHRAEEGRCEIDGDVWQDGRAFRAPHERPVGYVFQEASLFPHLSVRRNLLFGARRSRAQSGSSAFDEVVDLLGVEPLLDRAPHNLSGGERQRVAIGRALLSRPKLLLMDEPLSALDRRAKDEILPYLERLHGRLALPVIYVSHEMAELERLADHLVLMAAGRVIATGPLGELQSDPALPLAVRREAAVSLDAVTGAYDGRYGLLELAVAGGTFLAPMPEAPAGQERRVRIAAADVSLALDVPPASTILNVLPGRIMSAQAVSPQEILTVVALGQEGEGARLLARITRRSWDKLQLREGIRVFAQIKSVSLAPAGKPGRESPRVARHEGGRTAYANMAGEGPTPD